MYKRNLAATMLAGLVLSAVPAFAEPRSQSNRQTLEQTSCVFDKYKPVAASPYMGVENVGYGTYSFLKGAQIYIPAQPGLTKEWLALTVQRALAADALCDSEVKPSQVSVTSAGAGFWVQLSALKRDDAPSLLEWAKQIASAHAERSGALTTR